MFSVNNYSFKYFNKYLGKRVPHFLSSSLSKIQLYIGVFEIGLLKPDSFVFFNWFLSVVNSSTLAGYVTMCDYL